MTAYRAALFALYPVGTGR